MRDCTRMEKTLRGRPRLDIPLQQIVDAVRCHQQVTSAARQLGCSPAYIHKRFKLAGMTLAKVLEAWWKRLPVAGAHRPGTPRPAGVKYHNKWSRTRRLQRYSKKGGLQEAGRITFGGRLRMRSK